MDEKVAAEMEQLRKVFAHERSQLENALAAARSVLLKREDELACLAAEASFLRGQYTELGRDHERLKEDWAKLTASYLAEKERKER